MSPHQESLSFRRSFRRKRLAPIVISSAPVPATVKPKPKPTTTQPVTKSSVISTSTIPTSIPSTISINRSPTFHATSSSSSPTTMPLPGSDNGTNSSRSTNITGIVVGVALGIVVVVFVALGLIFRQRRRRRRRQSEDLVKAEQYQQQRMTGDNASEVSTPGRSRSQDHNYGNRRVGSSYIEPAPSYNGKNPMNIEVGMEGNEINSLHMNQQQKRYSQSRQGQPDWWGKKSPLEYFQQVPPVEVLYRTEEDIPEPKQQKVQNDEGQDPIEIEAARNLVSSVDHRPTNIQESIPLHVTQGTDRSIRMDSEEDAKRQSLNHTLSPQRQEQHLKPKEYQQLQQQQPQQQRLLPIRAFSPLGVEFDEPKETDRVTSVYYPPPPVNPSTNPYYLPPPPTNFSAPSPGPRSRISTLPTEPSPGFYDSLMEGEDIEVPMSPPPPIPKATRPISTSLPTMIALAADQDLPRFQIDEVSSTQPIQSNSNISLNSPPSLMHFDSGRAEGSREASVESPVERSNSDMSESFYGSNEPRMGGRMPRIAH